MRNLVAGLAVLALTAAAHADSQDFARIARGRYLAVLSDCAACHTAPGGAEFAGGLPLETPFGAIVSPNITPDVDTGIGGWSDADFVAALRDGRGHDGVRLYPAMPYPSYTRLSDDDVAALRAYFATVPPVRHAVVANQLPFPFNIRLAMLAWNWINFTPGRFQPDPRKSADWNRGAYLVEGAAHCGVCHTPKTMLGGDKTSLALTGGALQGWFAPDITGSSYRGVGSWSKADLVQYLKTGANAWTLASGPMADAVAHSTSLMSDDDIAAIATYLRDTGAPDAGAKPAPLNAGDSAMRAGAAIYKDACAACHKDTGAGEAGLFPKLAGSALVQQADATTLVRLVLQGSRAVATAAAPTGPAMPAFDWRLSDAQAAAVISFIRNSWGNAAPAVAASVVTSQRAALARAP